MEEIWKNIEGYELYKVSNYGRVKSLKFEKERILKPGKNKCGYLRVNLFKYGKRNCFSVHRLVAIAFIPNTLNLPQVNHKDENKENNCAWNLEWCNEKYNTNYGTRNKNASKSLINNNKLSKKVICVETNIVYPSSHEAERQTGIFQQNIISCCKGRLKSTGKLHWKYV